MTIDPADFADYVEHPRYGRGPRVTGLNPQTDFGGDTYIHTHSPLDCRVPDTAIVADTERQVLATVAVSHYYDVKRKCRDCERMFLFFAAEQKHWYEELGFALHSDCVRCVPCRREQQDTASLRERYEAVVNCAERTDEDALEAAECAVTLGERGVFGTQSLERARGFLKSIPAGSPVRDLPGFAELMRRLAHRA